MNDFQRQIEAYAFPSSAAKSVSYLSAYWLSEAEYVQKWKPIQDTIFEHVSVSPPAVRINEQLAVFSTVGGVLFTKEDFRKLAVCLKDLPDTNFAVVEDFDIDRPPHGSGPVLRLRYPKSIHWDEMCVAEEGISYELFGRPVRNYFVFGDSGLWGKYAANDWPNPRDYWAFDPAVTSQFLKVFDHLK
jgi:hypothetical protein